VAEGDCAAAVKEASKRSVASGRMRIMVMGFSLDGTK
jgi:hypothetical protein